MAEREKNKASPIPTLGSLDQPARRIVMQLLNREIEELSTAPNKEETRFIMYISPTSTAVKVWNTLFLVLFYVVQMQISLSLAFGPHFFEDEVKLGGIYLPIYIMLFVLLLLDIFFSLFKGYYAFGKGKVIDDGNMIIRNYMSSQFPFDLIVVVGYLVPLVY